MKKFQINYSLIKLNYNKLINKESYFQNNYIKKTPKLFINNNFGGNKKKCLILVCGVIRNIENYENNFINNLNELIINNNNNYEFDIIINTSFKFKNVHPKWNDKSTHQLDINKFNDINKNFNTNNIKVIDYDLPEKINTYVLTYRIYNIFKNNNIQGYNKLIYMRPDCFVTSKMILDEFIGFNIISSNYIRPGYFNNRDWDGMWVGDNIEFKIWCYLNCLYQLNMKIYDNEIKIDYPEYINPIGSAPYYIENINNSQYIENSTYYNDNKIANLHPTSDLIHSPNFVINYLIKKNYHVKATDVNYKNIYYILRR